VQALQIVQFKLGKLEKHLQTSNPPRPAPARVRVTAISTNRFRPASEPGSFPRHALNFSANFFSNFASFGEIVNMQ
jgi:hypothetical protein